ncbi:MAG: hypothetical protein C5B56_05305 [Proteobacteria bacterium]|nr:MAG: hypothetical protein C5B56_05305 [Pseudomonadota bacterium]
MQRLNPWGPLFFGLGFVAPLTATLLILGGLESSLLMSPTWIGLALGGAWGLYAKFRGSWI